MIDEFIAACNLVQFEKSDSDQAAGELYEKYKEKYTFTE
jgi:hypothetical protein